MYKVQPRSDSMKLAEAVPIDILSCSSFLGSVVTQLVER